MRGFGRRLKNWSGVSREGSERRLRSESRIHISEVEQFPVKKKGLGVAKGMDGENGEMPKVIGNEDSKALGVKNADRQCSKEARARAWAKILVLTLAAV